MRLTDFLCAIKIALIWQYWRFKTLYGNQEPETMSKKVEVRK